MSDIWCNTQSDLTDDSITVIDLSKQSVTEATYLLAAATFYTENSYLSHTGRVAFHMFAYMQFIIFLSIIQSAKLTRAVLVTLRSSTPAVGV